MALLGKFLKEVVNFFAYLKPFFKYIYIYIYIYNLVLSLLMNMSAK